MFTGIVERLAPVVSVGGEMGEGGGRGRAAAGRTLCLRIAVGDEFGSSVKVGDSLAINGVCLSVTARQKKSGIVSFDVIDETRRMTNLSQLRPGSKVNVERSLVLSDRISGHLVSGHIDGTGRIRRLDSQADGSTKMWVDAPTDILSLTVRKGSVAVDGVSLTVVDVNEHSFSFCLIPLTLEKTTLGQKKKGATVNIEADMIGKLVKRFVTEIGGDAKRGERRRRSACLRSSSSRGKGRKKGRGVWPK